MSSLQSYSEIEQRLRELLADAGVQVRLRAAPDSPSRCDAVLEISHGKRRINLDAEIKSGRAVLHKFLEAPFNRLPSWQSNDRAILIAPYLSPRQRELCRRSGIFFIDLSGNAFLRIPELVIDREGFKNKYPESEPPVRVFSDKASLVLRAMLDDPRRRWGVRELAEKVGVDAGFTSRVLRRIQAEGFAHSEGRNTGVHLVRPKELLDSWSDSYSWRRNRVRGYYLFARGSDEILSSFRSRVPAQLHYAFSLQAGASLVAPMAAFGEVHAYVADVVVADEVARRLGLEPADQGANIFLMSPYYKRSVFWGLRDIQGLPVVSDIQLYLDLLKYPLRGEEQAEYLYRRRIGPALEGKNNDD